MNRHHITMADIIDLNRVVDGRPDLDNLTFEELFDFVLKEMDKIIINMPMFGQPRNLPGDFTLQPPQDPRRWHAYALGQLQNVLANVRNHDRRIHSFEVKVAASFEVKKGPTPISPAVISFFDKAGDLIGLKDTISTGMVRAIGRTLLVEGLVVVMLYGEPETYSYEVLSSGYRARMPLRSPALYSMPVCLLNPQRCV